MPQPAPALTFGRRLPALVLAAGIAGGVMAVAMPATDARAMVMHDCVYNPYWESTDYVSDHASCQ